jgi:hypothetical protein
MDILKTCSKCKVEKPISEFRKQSATKDGLRYDCKSCQDARQKSHYQQNKERYVSNAKKWQAAHPDLLKQIKEKYIVKARLKSSQPVQPSPQPEAQS